MGYSEVESEYPFAYRRQNNFSAKTFPPASS